MNATAQHPIAPAVKFQSRLEEIGESAPEFHFLAREFEFGSPEFHFLSPEFHFGIAEFEFGARFIPLPRLLHLATRSLAKKNLRRPIVFSDMCPLGSVA